MRGKHSDLSSTLNPSNAFIAWATFLRTVTHALSR